MVSLGSVLKTIEVPMVANKSGSIIQFHTCSSTTHMQQATSRSDGGCSQMQPRSLSGLIVSTSMHYTCHALPLC
jgi:hypothetical protein